MFESYKHEGSSQSATGETYFAKFLTSERLLPLQISDANFRRHILVQCLTLFRYLLADVKFKPNKLVSNLKMADQNYQTRYSKPIKFCWILNSSFTDPVRA